MMSFLRKRRVLARDDAYKRATPEQLQEYNAFGPWIYPVESLEDMPPLFRPWYSEVEDSLDLLKIPIDVERRHARPGQDLYKAVLAADQDRVVVLIPGPSGAVEFRPVPWGDLAGIRNYHVLLFGELTIFLTDGTAISLSYNTVSLPLVERFLDRVSERLTAPVARRHTAAPWLPVNTPYFQNLIREHQRRHPGCEVIFCEEPGVRYRDERRRRQKSGGLLVLRTATEWLFIDLGASASNRSSYATSTTWVPFSKTPGFHLSEPTESPAGRAFVIDLPGHPLVYRLLGPDDALRGLISVLTELSPASSSE